MSKIDLNYMTPKIHHVHDLGSRPDIAGVVKVLTEIGDEDMIISHDIAYRFDRSNFELIPIRSSFYPGDIEEGEINIRSLFIVCYYRRILHDKYNK